MRFGDARDQVQTEAAALDLLRHRHAPAIERLEDVLAVFGVDAQAVILDGEQDRLDRGAATGAWLRADAQPTLIAPVLDRVADQVLQCRTQRRHVAEDRWQVLGDLDLDVDFSLFNLGPARADRIVNQVGRLHRYRRRRRAAGGNAGQLQHALNRFGQPAGFALDGLTVLAHPRGVADDAVGEVAGSGANDRHRRPQFMRHRGHKLHLLARQFLRAPGRHHNQPDGHRQQQQHAGADQQVALANGGDRGFKRAGAMLGH